MELLKHELYKIFSRRVIYITLALLVIPIFLLIYLTTGGHIEQISGGSKEDLYNYISQFEGEINEETKEKLETVLHETNKDEEYKKKMYTYSQYTAQSRPRIIAISDILKYAEAPFHLSTYFSESFDFDGYTMEELKENLLELRNEEKEHTYKYKNKLLAEKMYGKLESPKFKYIEAWNTIFNDKISIAAYILTVMILIGVSPVFSQEYSDNVSPIILSSKKGRKELVRAKIIASAIYCIPLTLIVNAIKIFTITKLYGIQGYNTPIQSLFDFISSPYKLNIAQFIFVYIITSIIGGILFSLVINLVSQVTKSSMITFFISGCIFAYPIVLKELITGNMWWKKPLLNINITEIIKAKGIYKFFSTINILGKPILYPCFMLGFSVLLGNILIFIIHHNAKKQEVV